QSERSSRQSHFSHLWLLFGATVLKFPPSVYLIGAGTLALAGWLIATGRMLGFVQFLGIIFAAVGLSLLCWGLYRDLPFYSASLVLLVSAVCTTALVNLRGSSLQWLGLLLGSLAGMFAAFCVIDVYTGGKGFFIGSLMPFGWQVIAAIGALGLALTSHDRGALSDQSSQGRPDPHKWSSFATGWTVLALFGVVVGSGPTFLVSGGWTNAASLWTATVPLDLGLNHSRAFAMVVLACGAAWLLLSRETSRKPLSLVLIAAGATLSYIIVGLAAPLAVLAIALVTGRRIVAVFAAICAAWIIGSFYYWLGWPLVNKAYLLTILGGVIGITAYAAIGNDNAVTEDHSSAGQRPAPTSSAYTGLLVVASVAMAGAVNAAVIWDKEQILANGRQVFVALAPADPRSIIQGDYMNLRFELPRTPRQSRRTTSAPKLKWAVATLDSRQVATIDKLVAEVEGIKSGQIILNLKTRKGRPVLGTDAYFFKEGTAKKFQDARFGEFRVDASGEAILVGLADEDLKPL
ncbi:MAG: GDYXXLXY domain-containing protein, partial [Pseudomonadota bacterium]